jgi:hypothetical protein
VILGSNINKVFNSCEHLSIEEEKWQMHLNQKTSGRAIAVGER